MFTFVNIFFPLAEDLLNFENDFRDRDGLSLKIFFCFLEKNYDSLIYLARADAEIIFIDISSIFSDFL